MKQLTVLNLHSFVDLITNSSSELFVCDTEKSIKMVKEVVEKIINNYYDELGVPCPNIWEDIFCEPYIEKIDFDIRNYPNQEDLRMVQDWDYFRADERQCKCDADDKYPMPDKFINLKYNELQNHVDYEEYKAWSHEHNKYRCDLLRERVWNKRSEAVGRILDYFKVANKDRQIEDQPDFCGYQTYLDYGITTKRGNIILCSASDNTVPYDCWDRINIILNGRNYHLG
jgi:hypothetical protein